MMKQRNLLNEHQNLQQSQQTLMQSLSSKNIEIDQLKNQINTLNEDYQRLLKINSEQSTQLQQAHKNMASSVQKQMLEYATPVSLS